MLNVSPLPLIAYAYPALYFSAPSLSSSTLCEAISGPIYTS